MLHIRTELELVVNIIQIPFPLIVPISPQKLYIVNNKPISLVYYVHILMENVLIVHQLY